MADLVLDTFSTGTPGDSVTTRTGDSGVTWAIASGDFKLRTGGGCYPTGATAIVYADVNVAQDMEIDATLDVVTQPSPAGSYCGLMLNAGTDGNNYVSYLLNFSSSHALLAYNTVGGSATELAAWLSTLVAQLPVGEHTIRWLRNGTLFRGWVNNREFFRIKITTPPALNRIALSGGAATSTTGVHIKRVAARQTTFSTNQIQCIGDSQTAGDYFTAGLTINQVPRADQWSARLMNLLYADGFEGVWANAGVSGQTAATLLADLNTTKTTHALPHAKNQTSSAYGWGTQQCRHADADHDVVVLWIGANDFIAGDSAATVLGRTESIASALRGAGFKVVVCTQIECAEGVASIPAGYNAKVATYNAGILAGASNYDGIARPDLVPQLNDYTDFDYRSEEDGIHLMPDAQPFMATAVYEAVEPLVMPQPLARWHYSANSPFNLSPFIL